MGHKMGRATGPAVAMAGVLLIGSTRAAKPGRTGPTDCNSSGLAGPIAPLELSSKVSLRHTA